MISSIIQLTSLLTIRPNVQSQFQATPIDALGNGDFSRSDRGSSRARSLTTFDDSTDIGELLQALECTPKRARKQASYAQRSKPGDLARIVSLGTVRGGAEVKVGNYETRFLRGH